MLMPQWHWVRIQPLIVVEGFALQAECNYRIIVYLQTNISSIKTFHLGSMDSVNGVKVELRQSRGGKANCKLFSFLQNLQILSVQNTIHTQIQIQIQVQIQKICFAVGENQRIMVKQIQWWRQIMRRAARRNYCLHTSALSPNTIVLTNTNTNINTKYHVFFIEKIQIQSQQANAIIVCTSLHYHLKSSTDVSIDFGTEEQVYYQSPSSLHV